MSKDIIPADLAGTDPADADAVFAAFFAARDAAPSDRALLKQWADRYPDLADELIAADLARLTAPRPLSARLAEGGPPDPVAAETARRVLAARRESPPAAAAKPPLVSLVSEAQAQGLDVPSFAEALRLDLLLLTRLERRLLDAATIPLALVRRLGELLGRPDTEVAAYLSGGPRLAAAGHYRSRRAPALESASPAMSFREALDAGQNLSAADRAYWQGEADAGVLGD